MDNDQVSVVPIVLALFAIVALVLFVAMMGFFVFLFSRAVKRRSYDQARGQQMQQAAASIGFGFQAQAHLSALPFLSSFELFEGYPLRLENLMTGKLDHRDAVVFDLAYRNVGSRGGGGVDDISADPVRRHIARLEPARVLPAARRGAREGLERSVARRHRFRGATGLLTAIPALRQGRALDPLALHAADTGFLRTESEPVRVRTRQPPLLVSIEDSRCTRASAASPPVSVVRA